MAKKTKYYHRVVTRRESINRWGKLGYIAYDEFVKTSDVTPFNKGLKIRFQELNNRPKCLIHASEDQVIAIRHDISSSESYFRKSVSNYSR